MTRWLHQDDYPGAAPFDAVFCRNVLIYFKAEDRRQILGRMIKLLGASGYLFLGHAETLNAAAHDMVNVIPTVYAKKSATSIEPRASRATA